MNRFVLVRRSDFDCGVTLARRRAADEQRDIQTAPGHLGGDMSHLVEGRGDETAQTDDVCLLCDRRIDDFVRRHHDAEIDHIVIVAAQHHADDIFADVMHVAFNRGENQLGPPVDILRGLFFRLEKRRQKSYGFFHHARAFDHLRQKHLARTEEVADHVHAVHQGAFDHG